MRYRMFVLLLVTVPCSWSPALPPRTTTGATSTE